MSSIIPEHLNLFKSLFKAREDVFAVRWEKNGKGNYIPAFSYDPHRYRIHQAKGGTFQTFQDKTYKPLTDQELINHLTGKQVAGVYPLLTDNISWFIAADFDEADWLNECRNFLRICNEYNIPAYLERSRSGNGGHVWIFFEEPYAAFKSRRIILSLLEQSGSVSIFDKNSSFDRLFPNQDTLSGKGLGNLIALPLNQLSLEQGNNCFIDPDTLLPYINQWQFLKEVKRISLTHLNELYEKLQSTTPITEGLFKSIPTTPGTLTITLSNEIRIARTELSTPLITFLKEELNFVNSEYQVKKNINKSTFGIKRYFKLLNEHQESISIPRGFIGKLLTFCKENHIEYTLIDQRVTKEQVLFKGSIELRDYQKAAKEAADKKSSELLLLPRELERQY